MDFFANAFVERDVVDSKNMVVKDGIHIREKALSSECGVRSRTHFVERKQYTEQDMMSDYNFLEEVGRTVDNAARENIKLESGSGSHSGRKKVFGPNGVVTVSGGNNRRDRHNNNRNRNQGDQDGGDEDKSVAGLAQKAARDLERLGAEGSGSYRDKQLIMQAKKRGTHLIMMADGLKKRKENHTNWKDKLNKLNWTIEWLFPEIDLTKRILEHRNDDSLTLTTLLTGTLSKDENKDIAAKYAIDTLDQCRLYFVIPLRNANQPALYPISTAASLQQALKFKKVLEYPTILVLGPSSSSTSNSCATHTAPSALEQQDSTTTTSTETEPIVVKEEPAAATTGTSAPADPAAADGTKGASAASVAVDDLDVSVADQDKPATITTTTAAAVAVSVVHPVPSDHTHPLLEKYTIEEPPSQWPKRPIPNNPNSNNQNSKRPNDTTAAATTNKKAKIDDEGKEVDVEMPVASNDSSDDDSDSSDSDDSSSDDDSSDDSSDSSNANNETEEVDMVAGADEQDGTTEEGVEQEEEEEENVNLKIGQAILEAFNQDFGGSAE
ncbi:Box C/D snoRNA protein 1 [Linnemannia exigua]|uniref:Box C/D snoRNA protein 1 n=1 Tax=Linnemannia exigua TaxID=604196 RepID=A0AAD4DI95_9FUNG|nr:Box C/D snoRNA protein 1 [Linnemannia exigua]